MIVSVHKPVNTKISSPSTLLGISLTLIAGTSYLYGILTEDAPYGGSRRRRGGSGSGHDFMYPLVHVPVAGTRNP